MIHSVCQLNSEVFRSQIKGLITISLGVLYVDFIKLPF